MEVGVADLVLLRAFGCQGFAAAAAVGPPATTVGDVADFLRVHVEHVAWIAGDDLARSAHVFPFWGDVSDPVQPEPVQPPCHCPNTAPGMALFGEFAGDPAC